MSVIKFIQLKFTIFLYDWQTRTL